MWGQEDFGTISLIEHRFTGNCPSCGSPCFADQYHDCPVSSERILVTERVVKEGFVVKDSGKRQEFESGMRRDTTEGKTDYTLVLDGPMLERWAAHLTKGAKKYDKGNWLKANGEEELRRFRESAMRHFIQWMKGDTDEDHAAAVFFNINGAEYVKSKL